jgi:hypothetical protein
MKSNNNFNIVPSSFKDPSGYVFTHKGNIYRQVDESYKKNYESLMQTGLYKELIDREFLVKHEEVAIVTLSLLGTYKIIKPELIPFISYPYEWSFNQFKDAALLTLEIQKIALKYDMSLKDASAYNIQFYNGKPVFIDTLSFERYVNGKPWVAYRQFCQHFFAPLALMSLLDVRLNRLMQIYIDGIPLDLASALLPVYLRFKTSIFSHIFLQAQAEAYIGTRQIQTKNLHLSHIQFLAFLDNLESSIKKLRLKKKASEWADYYDKTNYTVEGFESKKKIVIDFLNEIKPSEVWDLGANNGLFSRLASDNGIFTVAFDMDPIAVNTNYLETIKNNEKNLLPLIIDLANPSPSMGWDLQEKMSLIERGPVDTVLALALIHHLVISNNLPYKNIAEFFSKIGNSLIIEFVPKHDSKVKQLLSTREDIFNEYNQESFEREFSHYFRIIRREKIKFSERIMYLMSKGIPDEKQSK